MGAPGAEAGDEPRPDPGLHVALVSVHVHMCVCVCVPGREHERHHSTQPGFPIPTACSRA